jgi:SAM-dependent methyltransferase
MTNHQHHHHNDRVRRRFDPARAQRLDDPERFTYLAPADVIAFVDAPPNAVVLDFGTGTGTYAIAFAQQRPDCTVVGLDLQPDMLALLRAKPAAAAVRSGGPELLSALAGTIDRVMAINVLHELEDEHVRELFAALGPTSQVAFIDWNADVERPYGPAKEHLFGPAEAERFLAPFGFRLRRTQLFPYHYAILGALRQAQD